MPVSLQIPKKTWSGAVQEVTLGATPDEGGTRGRRVTVGGETTLPFLHFEGEIPHRPVVAVEVFDREPDDWPLLLLEAWGDVLLEPGAWAAHAEEEGADVIVVRLSLSHVDGTPTSAAGARSTVRRVLDATPLPLIVFGPGQANADAELLRAVAEEAEGERIALGICEENHYREIVEAALEHDHLVTARSPMDVNLCKQLNILITDVGLPADRILMDPTTASLGYGLEYGYSVMERLRLAALQGDRMTQMPMLVTPGAEVWRQKEARVGDGVPASWGSWEERAVLWETMTATTLLEAGADIVTVRHPDTVRQVQTFIQRLMEG